MASRKYFGTDGIRGLVGQYPISPEFVMKLGYAAGKVLAAQGTKKVLIGKDTRISGYMLESALEAGFSAAGIDIGLLGPMPTPGIAYLTKTFRAEAGIVISASHNPYYDNGIKFFSQDGEKLPDEVELAIEAELDKPMGCVDSAYLGKASRIEDAAGRYIEFCKSNFPSQLSLENLTIVVDCAHGATYHIAPNVFRELGATVIEVGTSPNGTNINDGCGATSMKMVSEAVVEHKADLGIALDGDGDRLMMVDHTGYVIDGDEVVYIIACNDLQSGSLQGGVVGTLMSNMGLELALEELGIPFARSNVGDRYVMELLREKGWQLGAENSGHIINLSHTSTGDGIIAALNVLTALKQQEKSLFELRQGMTMLPQILVNVRFTGDSDPINSPSVQAAVDKVNARLSGRGRVLLRKSGTEPLIRVMVEGPELEEVTALANEIAESVKLAS
ncbi:phosphoglucosamine mutase [Colwellia sp. 4_MG-2023]|jgi:phosphoglucosamine mutase|uniref:phosphoglucosamine mutase n=1 Tax=unclassified Colwellia TaxID=196834 RepID=UPI001C0A24D2|nr:MULTISPECIES: phosphoglucosamine mutase [unclassified Colwellia]MBU2924643.1 phosphoglucosamine mutase [Colwellia sp. C2M11]MDO6507838.1 phosphoglucosamine mutase [Colwellia sp. 5_MG-2023]MDO6556459.1 phosphoglucosamine mutase [Colwellia sp. 4_MG-2023]MDO6653899.1 phosphoglucosamine mutase [Colwellia sp. 3_MG-2023]MDO6666726.1 phosphoglucosamine mutase [Colwellia sp. 2_MG-2023]